MHVASIEKQILMSSPPLPFTRTDAVATAVPAIAILTQTIVIISSGFVVRGVATRAVRLISRERPDNCFRVAAVAGRAAQVAGMISRVGGGQVPEGRRQPCIHGMAKLAILARYEMIAAFIVRMATCATAGNVGMVETCGQPCNG